ncbi:TPA: hypothetical protein N0F65_001204 [Lagenidium giganteum]|uniref:Methenyltetrahydrofolate cyclohydrolase n=1 Tax=Lagenidium giganteum TaxID=4803 RepID=A0AAV2Z060_9STRA|nr:TPA: hypothetical protein N0F65_001204 [Lagenidium giganteum]
MRARVIDGKALAALRRAAIAHEVRRLRGQYGRPPALGLIMVGNRKDSALYVKHKQTACAATGIRSVNVFLDEQVQQQVRKMNADPTLDGILVQVRALSLELTLALLPQLPLPASLDSDALIDQIHPSKDVDGLHPFNVGELSMQNRSPYLIPCTAKGILELLDHENVELEGKTAVVIGRSNLVGNPVSMLLRKRHATVIQCHSRTVDLGSYVRQADVLVVACGQPNLVPGAWLKPNATVIDVGINFIPTDPQTIGERTYKIVGDVCRDAADVAGALTPVPGGVGPMTIAMLLHNVVSAFKRHVEHPAENHIAVGREQEVHRSKKCTSE